MKKVVAFVLLATGGVALLAWTSGGFLAAGNRDDRPAVTVEDDLDSAAEGIPIQGFGSEDAPPARILDTKESRADVRQLEPRSWTDRTTGERFEYPHFLAWTLSVEDVKPFRDPATGTQGFGYERVRIVLYRDPANHAEAEALRDDPVKNRLVWFEVDAERGSGTWDLRAGIRPEKPVVRLTRSARLRDHVRDLTVLCEDALVDLDEETAEGTGDIAAEHPACSLRGRGMRLDERGARFEILDAADVRVHADPGAGGRASDGALGGGAMRPSRLRAAGGAVVTTLPPSEGKGYRVVIERGVQVEQVDGPTLDADAAQIVVLQTPAEGTAKNAAYRLRTFIAEGHVAVVRRDATGGTPSLLSVFCDRLFHDATTRGPGRTVLEGSCRATYRGEFSTGGRSRTRGLVRLSSRRSMSLGPPAEDQPEAYLQLALDGDAVVERTEASGDEAADRIEADRIDLLLASERDGRRPAADGPIPGDPGGFVATAFSATGGVRLDGPRIVGSADSVTGLHLDGPEFRLIADGAPHFDVASDDESPPASDRPGAAPRASGPGAAAEDGKPRGWRLGSLRASGEVAATLRAGSGPMQLEGDTLVFDERTGAVLEKRSGGAAWVTLPGGNPDERVAAPWIGFDPVRGRLSTRGRTDASFRVGGASEATNRTGRADRVAVRAGGRIQVDGARAPGVDYRIRIEGGGTIETVGPEGVVDRLRALEIEAAIGQARTAEAGPLFGGPTAAKSAPPAPPTTGRPSAPATRWRLESGGLEATLGGGTGGAGDLRSFEATGGVVAKTDEHRVEGERLRFDAATNEVRIEGTREESARLRFGTGVASQRAWAPLIRVGLHEGKPTHATLSAPSTVVLFRPLEDGKAERIELRAEGELSITPKGAETRGRTALLRSERPRADAPFGGPATLWTPHLVVEADRLLGGGKAELRRVVARGEGTRFESGDPATDGFAAIGETIVYAAATRVVRIESTTGRVTILHKGGKPVEAKWATLDLKTGLFDFEGSRIEIGAK